MKIKVSWKKIYLFIAILILLNLLTISIIKIVKWMNDNDSINNQVDNINKNVEIKEINDDENTELVGTDNLNSPYWKYIKMNLFDVDFNELKSQNDEVRGWIKVNGTNVNYPYVQTSDNEYYLTHSFDKNVNEAGWLFMDYRNDSTDFDSNTIIYGHSRLDTTMFGSLSRMLKNTWYDNAENHVIRLSTEYENTLWQIFSVYKINNTTDYLTTYFINDVEHQKFINMIKNRSIFNFDASITTSDKILTLSTCYSDTEKTVIHAKLIKKQSKK